MVPVAKTTVSLIVLYWALGSSPAFSQEPGIRLDSLDRLAALATESVDIKAEGAILKLAPLAVLGRTSSSAAKVKELIDGLKGIYIKRFEFEKEGDYTTGDLDSIRAQLRQPDWTRAAGVHTGRGRQHVEAYIKSEGGSITGVTIISAEPRELIVAHVTGVIDIEKLAELFREIDLPWLEWTGPGKPKKE
ncbi:MAG TPA: DUF4252 domain-containing protein [Blastocatellia bacterium]|nr:DUF4252 domain-containing protein [Blastocatellia bacterium]